MFFFSFSNAIFMSKSSNKKSFVLCLFCCKKKKTTTRRTKWTIKLPWTNSAQCVCVNVNEVKRIFLLFEVSFFFFASFSGSVFNSICCGRQLCNPKWFDDWINTKMTKKKRSKKVSWREWMSISDELSKPSSKKGHRQFQLFSFRFRVYTMNWRSSIGYRSLSNACCTPISVQFDFFDSVASGVSTPKSGMRDRILNAFAWKSSESNVVLLCLDDYCTTIHVIRRIKRRTNHSSTCWVAIDSPKTHRALDAIPNAIACTENQ